MSAVAIAHNIRGIRVRAYGYVSSKMMRATSDEPKTIHTATGRKTSGQACLRGSYSTGRSMDDHEIFCWYYLFNVIIRRYEYSCVCVLCARSTVAAANPNPVGNGKTR